MKRTFILFNTNNLDFDQLTTKDPVHFITEIKSPDPNDVERMESIIAEIKERLESETLNEEELAQLSLLRNVLLYPLLYEIKDIFHTYDERRKYYLNEVQEKDLLLLVALSHNKYRRRHIESVLDYSKFFSTTNESLILLSKVEELYDRDKLTGFQVSSYEKKSEVTKNLTRLALSVSEEFLLKGRVLIHR